VTDPSPQAAPSEIDIRPVGGAELPFILDSWASSHMRSPGQPFGAAYQRYVLPQVKELLNRDDVWIIAAFGPYQARQDAILGWLAWTPGELPAIHYAFTRGAMRKRGIFSALLDKAMVGRRWLYTHKGQLPRYGRKSAPTYDKKVIAALARRGVAGVYVDASEWLERMRR
jgi:hypothetical protein